MSVLGSIGRPEAANYMNRKKIYFVRNLYLPKNATEQYRIIVNRYWDEVDEHLHKLEIAGKLSKIFCESIYMTGEETMHVLRAMNTRLEQLVKKMIDAGGRLIPLEDKEIFGAYVDWNHCLVHVHTERVHKTVHKLLHETIQERFEHIKTVLQENIAEGEAGLLIMREEDRESLRLPHDVELFFVTPPAYDDLLKYIRDMQSGKEYWRI